MRHPSSFHSKTFQVPVAGGDGPAHAGGDVVAMHLHVLICIQSFRSRRFLQDLVDVELEIMIELLEEILEQE